MLDISKQDIIAYANEKHIQFHEDSTNSNDSILRNSIRLNLIPLLNKKFSGWKTGVLHGSHRNALSFDLIESLSKKIIWEKCKNGIKTDAGVFCEQHISVRLAALKKALDIITPEQRISNSNLEKFASDLKQFTSSNIRFFKEKNFIKIVQEVRTKKSFFAIIDKNNSDSLYCFYSDEEKDL
jgi:tRNA(Ile)-lysidine synthase